MKTCLQSSSSGFRDRGHKAVHIEELGLRGAVDSRIAEHARQEGFCIVTRDLDFADVRTYPPSLYSGLIVIRPHKLTTTSSILSMLEGLLDQEDLINDLSGRLAIVEPGRNRIFA